MQPKNLNFLGITAIEEKKKKKNHFKGKDFHISPIDISFSIYEDSIMQVQREMERRIEKQKRVVADKEQQRSQIDAELNREKAYLDALLDTARWLPKTGDKEPTLRIGSDLSKARDFLRAHGRPQHIVEILKGLGKEPNKSNRISLSGSLGGYARKGLIFTKPEPNTFGLIEFENVAEEQPDISFSPMPPVTSFFPAKG
jgi:hypothetical protein